VNKSISVVSIGFYGPQEKTSFPTQYEVDVKVQDYDMKTVFGIIRKIVNLKGPVKVFHVEFETPIKIESNLWYTVSFNLKVILRSKIHCLTAIFFI
jgi:hypothetical protein